jgi:hypothetical protein
MSPGSATSPTSPPVRAGSIWRRCSISGPGGCWATRWPTTCAPSWWPTPSPWRPGSGEAPPPAPSSTATAAAGKRHQNRGEAAQVLPWWLSGGFMAGVVGWGHGYAVPPLHPEHGQRSPMTEPFDTHAHRAPRPPPHPPPVPSRPRPRQPPRPTGPWRHRWRAPTGPPNLPAAPPAEPPAKPPNGPADRTARPVARPAAWPVARPAAPAPEPLQRGRRRRRVPGGRRHRRRVGRRLGRRHDRNHRGHVDSGVSRQRGLRRRRDGRVGHRGRAGGLGRVHRDRGHGSPATSGGSVTASNIGFGIAIDTARRVVDELTGETL